MLPARVSAEIWDYNILFHYGLLVHSLACNPGSRVCT